MSNLIVAIYFHPEAYPPTLNAIGELSECFDQVTILHRPHLVSTWKYPPNVVTKASGDFITSKEQEAAPIFKKAAFFFSYVAGLYNLCRKLKPEVILVYDTMSLYAYHLVKKVLTFEHTIWYHNHDVVERQMLRKFSIGWFAARSESFTFDYLDIFSLPSNDRLKYFPMEKFKGRYFFIPNYPSRKFYGQTYREHNISEKVRILFQGQVAPFRGIEQMIPLMAESLQGLQMELGLIGPCDQEYKATLLGLCEEYHVSDKVHFDWQPYSKLPELSATYHIGIALLSENNVMTTTIGTASNKLYEYAALGLPVIYYNSETLKKHLGKYAWAFGAEINLEDIRRNLLLILCSYPQLSEAARQDFMQELNFESGFAEPKNYIRGLI